MEEVERRRYARHLLLPGVEDEVYRRVREARILVIGAGGLGSPALYYLAAAGVGTLGIVDHDVVEISNLNRQVLYTTEDVGQRKAKRAAERLMQLNPGVRAVPYEVALDQSNAHELIAGYDIVLACADNTTARFAANDGCVRQRKVLVEAAVHHFSGQAMTIRGGETACYRCLFPVAPESGRAPYMADNGILGPVAGMLGTLQAIEALKVVMGIGEPLYDTMLSIDTRYMTFDTVPVTRDPACPLCGEASSAD